MAPEDNSPKIETKKINHSGNLLGGLREQPITETNVPLAEVQHTLDTPNSSDELGWIPDKGKTNVVESRTFIKRPRVLITLGLAAVVVGGGGAAVLANQSHPAAVATATPSKIPSATTTPESSTRPVTPEAIPAAESLKLDPALINNPNVLAKTIAENTMSQWINSGSGEANAKLAIGSSNYDTYAAEVANKYDIAYQKALLPVNWEANKSLVDWMHNLSLGHAQTLSYNYTTTPSLKRDSANHEAYSAGFTFISLDSVVVNPDQSVTITDTELPYDNSLKNSISQLSSQAVDGKQLHTSMTYAVIGGELKIVNVGVGQVIN